MGSELFIRARGAARPAPAAGALEDYLLPLFGAVDGDLADVVAAAARGAAPLCDDRDAACDGAMERLRRSLRARYGLWHIQLLSGFNLALYGFGSKRALLRDFADATLCDGLTLLCDAFRPQLRWRDVLSEMASRALLDAPDAEAHRDDLSFAEEIVRRLERQFDVLLERGELKQSDAAAPAPRGRRRRSANGDMGAGGGASAAAGYCARVYVVLHGLEALLARGGDAGLDVLRTLADSPVVHLVVTFEHADAQFLLDADTLERANLVFHECTTFERYAEEIAADRAALAALMPAEAASTSAAAVRSGAAVGIGLMHVLESLTPRHLEILQIVTRRHVEWRGQREADRGADGIPFRDFLESCMKKMLVQGEVQLRRYLVELRDHDLVVERAGRVLLSASRGDGDVRLIADWKNRAAKGR